MLSEKLDLPDTSRQAWFILAAVSATNVFTYGEIHKQTFDSLALALGRLIDIEQVSRLLLVCFGTIAFDRLPLRASRKWPMLGQLVWCVYHCHHGISV